MKKISFLISIILLMLFTLIGCGEIEETPGGTDIDITDPGNGENNPGNEEGNPSGGLENSLYEFKVSLLDEKGKVYIPDDDEKIIVIWEDDYTQNTAEIQKNGFATIKLDGDFRVYLKEAPKKYTYNPNIYNVDNINNTIQIQLLKVFVTSKGNGSGLYSEYRLSDMGTYKASIKNATQKVYYEYGPKKPGYYIIESLTNIYVDTINPIVDIYNGSVAAKFFKEKLDDGGASGEYTTNFKYVVKISEQELGGVFTFAVYADSKTGVYPLDVYFRISYQDEYIVIDPVSDLMTAKQADFTTPNYSSSQYTYFNADGGRGNYFSSGSANGTGMLVGSQFGYNEETGYWHKLNNDGSFGPILCAKVTQACPYNDPEDGALNVLEYQGNKALTLIYKDEAGNEHRENYKVFIESSYASACNSDGVCYVTMELKNFLQLFSICQRLFMDGNGWVETYNVYAVEEDQWLYACGYYIEK